MSRSQRTCIGCRTSANQDDLLRLARHPIDGSAVPDIKGNLPGRGAWVHPRQGCIQTVLKRPAILHRALKSEASCSSLLPRMRQIYLSQVLEGISLAAASGSIVGGHEQLVEALGAQNVAALILSENIADRTLGRLELVRDPGVETFVLPVTGAQLGFQVGKGPRVALGVFRSERTSWLMKQLRRRRDIG